MPKRKHVPRTSVKRFPRDGYKPVTADDVTDEKLVPGEMRALQREVRAGFQLLESRLTTIMDRFAARQDDHDARIGQLERGHRDTAQRLAALEGARKE